MARQMMRIASLVFIATMTTLSGCASTSRTHHLETVVANQRRAEMAYEKGDLPEALAGYEALTKTMPSNVDFWFRLGNIHVRMEQPDLAATAYERALQLDSGNAKAWHNLGIVRMRQAAAAFAQSAQSDGAKAPDLGKASAQMVHSLAELVSPARDQSSAAKSATSHKQVMAPAAGEATP